MAHESTASSERIAGSFRDPSGYVFKRNGTIFRAIDSDCQRLMVELRNGGWLRQLLEKKLIVGTQFVEDANLRSELAREHPGYENFLRHELIAPISYPYEWSVSMLADAAIHTLDLQLKLLEAGVSLKDATAYNIQFVNGRPTFIDISSFERPARLDVWFALGQFAQMFTFPLLLFRHHGWDFRSYFLGNINGRDVEQVARSFGPLERWLPRALFDVTLPAIFQRKANAQTGDGRATLEKPNKNSSAQVMNLQRLRGKLRKLATTYKPRGVWSDYTSTCSYDSEAEKAKKLLVKEFLELAKPSRVLDMGCNTGDYSFLATETGASVIAADGDQSAIEILYRRLQARPAAISPMVIDLSTPSPAIGHRNLERPSFFERLDVDCVLALALIHHLHVSGNLSIPAIRDLFFDMTRDYLVLEFVPTDDVMFKKLLQFRANLFGSLTLDSCRKVLAEKFDVVREAPIPGSPRTLWLLRKKRK
ncbi:MAG: class I SAM-dependent methyltransferase [Verrucomicrobia bacterium]|nr:class I SAM-dependent methyltransferase [Verrucomicrobiota bacterium]